MSRIYQGGGAERRFQSSARSRGFNPTQATSNAKQIQQQGKRVLEDLETLNRERQRSDQMSNLETSMSDRAAQLDLRQEQIAESGQFKLNQMYDSFAVANDQLQEKQQLQMRQQYDKASFELGRLSDSQALAREQFSEKQALQAKDSEERFFLGIEARGQQAQFAVDRAQLQAEQTVARANSQLMQTAVSSLINFGMAVGKDVMANQQEEEQKRQEREQLGMDFLYSDEGSAVSSTGSVNPVVDNQKNIQASEVAVESAIQTQAGGNPIEAENIRQPLADATMDRDLRQASIGEAAINFRPEFEALISDPSTVLEVNGQPMSLGTIKNRAELGDFLQAAARQLTSDFGVDGKDAHAMVMQYGRAVKSAMASSYSTLAPQVAAAAKQERYDAGLQNSAALMQTGNHQAAWEAARNSYVTSGLGMGKSNKEINDAVFKDMLSRSSDPEALASVLKTGQAGTEFGRQREYAEMIQSEQTRRLKLENQSFAATQTFTNNQIKEVVQNTTAALMATESPEESLQIRQQAIAQLSELGPLAFDDINRLSAEGKTNNNVFLGLQEAFEYGDPPSTQEIADAYTSGAITLQQKNEFMKMGMRSDEVNKAISKAGLPSVQKQLEATVTQALASADVDSTERKGMAAGIVANMLPHVEAEVRQFVISNPQATGAMIQQEAARIMDAAGAEIFNTKDVDGSRLQKQDNGQYTYRYDTSTVAPVTERQNPTTGKAQRVYIQHKVDQIPASASVNDAFLSRDEFLKAVEVWDAGRQTYSTRIKELSSKLGISPTSFVRKQAIALGYPAIEQVPQSYQKQEVPPSNMQAGFQALQSMDFPTRGAAYLAGNIMQESSWNGQRSWGEVQGDGSDRNGGLVSWMDGVAHNNFRLTKIEEYLGKPIAQASTAEQLQAMKWEMQRDYKEAYRIFMNPNATDVQLRRASRLYWGYGHEGRRYEYAQSLL